MLQLGIALLLGTCVLGFDANEGYFWQVTDFHYDANYSIHGNPNSMCHEGTNGSYSNSVYGNYLCDAPWKLVESAIQAMKSLHPNPDFILWTGDSVPHVKDSELDKIKVYENIGNVSLALHDVFPNTTVYPVLGNHDEYPSNHYPDKEHAQYYRDILTRSHWDLFLDSNASAEFRIGGYYKTMTSTGLMILGLNTNLYLSLDPETKDRSDPAGQLEWFQNQLIQARMGNITVILVAHVPPGYFERSRGLMWFNAKFNQKFVEILQRHSDVIAAQIYGHEHTDSFRMLKDEYGKPLSILFLSPAVTPWKSSLPGVGANNPGIRLYKYNQMNGDILDYTQYYLNISAVSPTWQTEYQAKEDYDIKTLHPKAIQDLAMSFSTNDTNLLSKYLEFNTVRQESPVCDADCVLTHFCSITELQVSGFKDCLKKGMHYATHVRHGLTTHIQHQLTTNTQHQPNAHASNQSNVRRPRESTTHTPNKSTTHISHPTTTHTENQQITSYQRTTHTTHQPITHMSYQRKTLILYPPTTYTSHQSLKNKRHRTTTQAPKEESKSNNVKYIIITVIVVVVVFLVIMCMRGGCCSNNCSHNSICNP